MKYKVYILPEAAADLQRLAKSEPKAFAKAGRFLSELEEHPKTGTGHPEPLKGVCIRATRPAPVCGENDRMKQQIERKQ